MRDPPPVLSLRAAPLDRLAERKFVELNIAVECDHVIDASLSLNLQPRQHRVDWRGECQGNEGEQNSGRMIARRDTVVMCEPTAMAALQGELWLEPGERFRALARLANL